MKEYYEVIKYKTNFIQEQSIHSYTEFRLANTCDSFYED